MSRVLLRNRLDPDLAAAISVAPPVGTFAWIGRVAITEILGGGTYVPPTGIPAPPFGMDQTVLSIHGDANYYTHWVDNTHPSATDSPSGRAGTPSAPRLTMPTASSLVAGDVVQVRGGTYSMGANYAISGTGTAVNPIFVTGPLTGTKPLFNVNGTRSWAMNGSYIITQYVDYYNGDQDFVALGGDHNVLRHCEITGTGTSVDGSGAAISASNSSYCVAAYNTIHDCGDWQSATENDLHGLGVPGKSAGVAVQWDHLWYLHNTVYHMGGDGCGNGHDNDHVGHDLYIGGNLFYDCRENGIDLKEIHNIVISENEVYGMHTVDTAAGEGIVVHYGPTTGDGPYNCWILNNYVHDCDMAIVSTGVQDTGSYPGSWWIGNLIVNCSNAGLDPDRGGGTLRCYHNTVVGCGVGIGAGLGSGSPTAWESKGNIYYDCDKHVLANNSTNTACATFNNDLMYQGGANLAIEWDTVTYTSLSAFKNATGQENSNQQADPLFVNAAGGNYRLSVGSPAINNGYDMSSVETTFQAAFGETLLVDIAGNARPNGVWDIGAYEYV